MTSMQPRFPRGRSLSMFMGSFGQINNNQKTAFEREFPTISPPGEHLQMAPILAPEEPPSFSLPRSPFIPTITSWPVA